MYEDELSLRYYVELLLSRWKLIVAGVLIAAIVAYLATSLQDDVYEAQATVAVLRSRTEVEFDSRIRTLADYELGGSTVANRQDGLIDLATSNSVVQQVLDEVGDSLEPEARNVVNLRNMVDAETSGDLITIKVSHSDPQLASEIANAWIQVYERHVNNVYSSTSSVSSNTASQLASAQERYEAAQQTLEEFAAQDPVPALERQIASRQALLDGYQQALVSMQVNPVTNQEALLQSYYVELQQIEGWLGDARALSEQVQADSDSAAGNLGNSLALVLLRSRIFGGDSNVTRQRAVSSTARSEDSDGDGSRESTGNGSSATILQVDLGDIPAEGVRQADVDALIQVLENRREVTQQQIDALVADLNDGDVAAATSPTESQLANRITALEDEIATLQGEVEVQSARRRELEQARDSTWETVQVLQGKQVEEEIATDSPGAEVRIADPAIVPTQPQGRGLLTNTALAGIAAFMFAVGAVIAADWWTSGEPALQDEEAGAVVGDRPAPEQEKPDTSAPVPDHSRRVPDSIT